MKKKRFSPEKIASILKEYEQGSSLDDLVRKHGICRASFYSWRKRYGGMDAIDMKRLKALEEENRKL